MAILPKFPKDITFSFRELSGSLGDLGLFISLVVAMATLTEMDFGIILIAAGAMNVATGFLFRQPIPVQPMKAIAAVAITEGLTPGSIMASGLLMASLLFIIATTRAIDVIDRAVPKPLVRGIQLGVGLKLAEQGIYWVQDLPIAGWDSILSASIVAAILLISLARNKPGLLFIFVGGFALLYLNNPAAYSGLSFAWPSVKFVWPSLAEWEQGLLRGAIPQLPLTLLNSVIAVCALSADYFPGRGIKTKKMALSVAIMNFLCVPFGAIPMCHGASGLAAQYHFGARTGGSVIMLGLIKILVGLLFGSVILGLLSTYPKSILGLMLIFAGIELGRSCFDIDNRLSFSIALLTGAGVLTMTTTIGFLLGAGVYAAIWIWYKLLMKEPFP